MRWWWQNDIVQDSIVSVLKEEVSILHRRHQQDCERIDRLMEALARRAGVDLVMPVTAPIPEPIHIPQPNPWKDPNPVTSAFQKEKN